MVFLVYTHWRPPSHNGSFVLLNKNDMNTKQVVAVIGASGNMGSAIAKAISKGNYRVLLQSENVSKVQGVVDEIRKNYPGSDVDVVAHPMDASWEADIIILAIPYVAE